MALEVTIVSGSGQEHAGCLLLTAEVLFVVSLSEDTQQQAFPITEVTGRSGCSLRRPMMPAMMGCPVLCRWSASRKREMSASFP